MVVDDLVVQGTRTSVGILLTPHGSIMTQYRNTMTFTKIQFHTMDND